CRTRPGGGSSGECGDPPPGVRVVPRVRVAVGCGASVRQRLQRGVRGADQRQLFLAPPALELLLAPEGVLDLAVGFHVDQVRRAVTGGEAPVLAARVPGEAL